VCVCLFVCVRVQKVEKRKRKEHKTHAVSFLSLFI